MTMAQIEKYKRQHCILPVISEVTVRIFCQGFGGLEKLYPLTQKVPMPKQSLIPPMLILENQCVLFCFALDLLTEQW